MRRLAAAAAVLLLAVARPAAAQVHSTYTGCGLYFCALVDRWDDHWIAGDPDAPLPQWSVVTQIALTLRQPFVDNGVNGMMGSLVGPSSFPDDDWDGTMWFNLNDTDLAGAYAGEILETGAGATGRTPPGQLGGMVADLSDLAQLPDGTFDLVWEDQAGTGLTLTPEPATLALVAPALLGAAFVRRRG